MEMRTARRCSCSTPLPPGNRTGLCKKCYHKEWRGKNREKIRTYAKRDYEKFKPARREKNRKWQLENPEKRTAHQKTYEDRHPGIRSEITKRWRESHPETYAAIRAKQNEQKKRLRPRYREYERAYVKANPEVLARKYAQRRAKRAAFPELIRAQEKKTRETRPWVYNAKSHRRRARLYGAFVENVDHRIVFDRDKGICGICQGQVAWKDFSVDHVVPLVRGGLHHYANVQTSHRRCNSRKNTKLMDEIINSGTGS